VTGSIDPTLIEAAESYESLFVPALFAPWAPLVSARAGVGAGQRVLDVACGTGVLAREAHRRTDGSGGVTGLDPHPGMLAVAGRITPEVEWREGVAEDLPFEDDTFDHVVSQFGLMFFPDRRRALREALRVAKPGARVTFAVWDTLEANPAYRDEVELLDRVAGRPAGDALRAPFVLGDASEVVGLFEEAGASRVEVTTRQAPTRFPAIRVMVEADVRGWLPVMGVNVPEETVERLLDEAETALRAYRRPDGAVEFPSSAHVVSGMAPS
jgi:SAM-dependent methyltransferase